MKPIAIGLFFLLPVSIASAFGYPAIGTESIDIPRPSEFRKATLTDRIIGPEPETLLIEIDYTIEGNLYITGDGVVKVNHARLTLEGFLYQEGNAKLYLEPGAYLYLPQEYLVQYPHVMRDSSLFQATDATIDGNTIWQGNFYDNSSYICTRTHFTHWNFRKLWDSCRFILEDANFVGDLTINDSCYVHLSRCDTILPWFGLDSGDVAVFEFPDYDTVPYFTLDSSLIESSGIDYNVIFEDCHHVAFAVESWANSSITVQNSSAFCAVFRIIEDSVYIFGLNDHRYYASQTMPFADREFIISNSYLHWWSWYSYGSSILVLDSCRYGEAISRDSSHIATYRTTSDGLPTSADALDNASFYVYDGNYLNTCSARNRGILILEETSVIFPPDHYCHQSHNSAMNNSRLFCVNSYLDSLPFALDTSLVLFAFIDSLDSVTADVEIPIIGSAWADMGSENDDSFDGFSLYHWDGITSVEIASSDDEVFDDTLGIWHTDGLDGVYNIKLTIRTTEGESLIAQRECIVAPVNVEEKSLPNDFSISAHPNPFNSAITIAIDIPVGDGSPVPVSVEIYDVNGRKIAQLPVGEGLKPSRSLTGAQTGGSETAPLRNGVFVWQPVPSLPSGVYLVRATVGPSALRQAQDTAGSGTETATKRVVYLK